MINIYTTSSFIKLGAVVAAAGAISYVVTKLCIRFAPAVGLVDNPRSRHIHSKPIPLGGGIGIAAGFITGMALLHFFVPQASHLNDLVVLLIPMVIMGLLGLADDFLELGSIPKLLVQIAVAAVLCYTGNGITHFGTVQFPVWLGYVITTIWFAGTVNAFNLIDGIDGLAAGLSVTSAVCLLMGGFLTAANFDFIAVLAVFIVSCGGFLRFNFPPAKIFMGNCGSMFIGSFFAVYAVVESAKSATFLALAVPLLAIGVPLFDVVLAIWRRFARKLIFGKKASGVMSGDSDHLHHRLLKRYGGSQRKTVLRIYLIAAVLASLSWVISFAKNSFPTLCYLVIIGIVVYTLRLADIEVMASIDLLEKRITRPSRRRILLALQPGIDLVLCLVAVLFTSLMAGIPLDKTFRAEVFFAAYAPHCLVFTLSKCYKNFWFRTGLKSCYRLLCNLILSSIASFVVFLLLYRLLGLKAKLAITNPAAVFCCYAFMLIIMVCVERFMLSYLEAFGIKNYRLNHNVSKSAKRVLLYGGGLTCRNLIANIYLRDSGIDYRVTGIIDDVRALHGFDVYGFRVLGSSKDLEKILQCHPFDELVVTLPSIRPLQLNRIKEFCRKNNIGLKLYRCILDELSTDSNATEKELELFPKNRKNNDDIQKNKQ